MALSGHKLEWSIRSFSRRGMGIKRKMLSYYQNFVKITKEVSIIDVEFMKDVP